MRFGEVVRALPTLRGFNLPALGERGGVSHADISKVENGKLDFGAFPSDDLIRRLTPVLGGDEEMRLLAAEKVPETIFRSLFERPDAFRRIARLDVEAFDRLLAAIAGDGFPGGSEPVGASRCRREDPARCGPGRQDPTQPAHRGRGER